MKRDPLSLKGFSLGRMAAMPLIPGVVLVFEKSSLNALNITEKTLCRLHLLPE